MRLLFNATNLRSEGGVVLLRHILGAFLEVRADMQVLLMINPELVARLPDFGERVEVRPFHSSGMLQRLIWEQVSLPGMIRREKIDTLFSFGNTGPLFPGCRQILYAQQSVPYTDFIPRRQVLRWVVVWQWLYGLLIGIAQLGSQRVVVPTSWLVGPMRTSILGLKPNSAYQVSLPGPPGFDSEEKPTEREAALLERVRQWREKDVRILFYPCFLSPYKNIPFLLDAISLLDARQAPPFRLVLTFDRDSAEYFACKGDILAQLERSGLENERVFLAGTLSREAVGAMYPLSDALVFPSLVETLGLPLLEAMSFGLPVIALDGQLQSPPNPRQAAFAREVCGEAGLYSSPADAAKLADVLMQFLNLPELSPGLIKASRNRADGLSWTRHARDILG